MDAYFFFVWILIILYVALFNSVYASVAIPTINQSGGNAQLELLPTKQISALDEYVRIVEIGGTRPWQYYLARHARSSTATIAVLGVIGLLISGAEVGQ